MKKLDRKVMIVTGASSGFGEAIASLFAKEGAFLALGARRLEKISDLAKHLRKEWKVEVLDRLLDVRKSSQVEEFVDATIQRFGRIDILVNNAGLALGREETVSASESDWQQMIDTNFMGAFRMSKAVLQPMLKQGAGHIVNIGSIAGHFAYERGGGYCGSKFALNAMTEAMRMELLGTGVRVTSIDPGMAKTEFSLVRFKGDRAKAEKVYEGMTPLTAQDVAEAVLFAVTRPTHVNVDTLLLTATDQAGVHKIFRRTGDTLLNSTLATSYSSKRIK